MNTVELLKQALRLAQQTGYEIRQEWLGGTGGGGCLLRGKKILFLDLALSPLDQLEQTLDALRQEPTLQDPTLMTLPIPEPLQQRLSKSLSP